MNALIRSEVEISRLFSEKEYMPAIQLTIEKLLEKAPKGVVRDVMLFNFLRYKLKEMPELYDFIPDMKLVFSQDFFKKELEKLLEKNKIIGQTLQLSETESQLNGILYVADSKTEELPNVKLLNFLFEKYKGKVLYLDIWATWCGPCTKEFESASNLHKYFKDKDVVFVNLCLESNIENWKQAIMKYNIGGENYFLDYNAVQLFRAENNLPGYPSYLIIGKNGVINPAPRPSNLEFAIQTIESCLSHH
jgi:thiol-disulfide isomerase/thioredoxin